MLLVLYQLAVKGEAGRPLGEIRFFEIITILYEDLVSQLTWHFSHAMMHVLFFYFVLYKELFNETKQYCFSYY